MSGGEVVMVMGKQLGSGGSWLRGGGGEMSSGFVASCEGLSEVMVMVTRGEGSGSGMGKEDGVTSAGSS